MSKHRKSEWEELKEKLAQSEYECNEARRMWALYREENTKLRDRVGELEGQMRALYHAQESVRIFGERLKS